jgi:hypothetical protein
MNNGPLNIVLRLTKIVEGLNSMVRKAIDCVIGLGLVVLIIYLMGVASKI